MKTKRDNFVNAAHRLAEAVTDYRNIRNDTVRDGMIQRFEFTFELGWKALKEYMLDAGMQNTLQFPKQVLREAYAAELIDDESVWLDMLNARNQTSHIYDDHTAAVIAAKIQNAICRVAKARRAVGEIKIPPRCYPTPERDIHGKPLRKSFYSTVSLSDAKKKAEEYRVASEVSARTGEAFVPSTYKQPFLTSTPMS